LDLVIGWTVVILKVAVGLGLVIFVHELGHFVVAKLCGVKCEKFYLGFDIAGWKLCKFRWGETEYGIGAFPLGGYVKMLGQEDNPAKLREEMERAKQQQTGKEGEGERGRQDNASVSPESSTSGSPSLPLSPSPPLDPSPVYDPRSFLAKSVPQRMAIISAGVVMNLVFAYVMAVVAFAIGTEEPPCVVGEVLAGDPAWQADLRPGDEILEIAGKKMGKFRDLQTAISLGDIDDNQGVPLLVQRPGTKQPFTVTVFPDRSRGAFMIGLIGPKTTKLPADDKTWLIHRRHAVIPGSSAARARPGFQNDDRIIQIDSVPIGDYGRLNGVLAREVDRKIAVTVERRERDAEGRPTGDVRLLTIPVEPQPLRMLGLVMGMGSITAVQAHSPAAAAGIRPGDRIVDPDGDPMTLPDRLRRQAGKTVELKIEREKEVRTYSVRLRQPDDAALADFFDSPVAAAALGVAYRVLNRVERVMPGSPADKAGMKPGDVLVKARLTPPDKEKMRTELGIGPMDDFADVGVDKIPFDDDNNHNWPALCSALQGVLPGTTVELTYARGKTQNKKEHTTGKIEPIASTDLHDLNRGFRFALLMQERHGSSLGEALTLGASRTLDDLTGVFCTVRALGTGRVTPRALGGPWTIIKILLQRADEGTVSLLLFLTFLSANLAVINFLPIPVLDGGHFMLLTYEGVRGKPANETVQAVLAYIGLVLILALMVWVFGLDFGLIPRR
jgi:regulator of sigma E protease